MTVKKTQGRKTPSEGDYTFEFDGETYALPPYKRIKSGLIRKVRRMSDIDATYTILEEICRPGSGYEASLEALDEMESADFDRVMTGWLKHSGVSLGE